ncbi:MAG: hypothetical protein JSV80_15635 [Acidobacteriota bacterium]|nr:MAG: hypothetical protein JSV80_15635 [Acidobacteriota bacterium]
MSVVAFDELVRVLRRPPQRLREWEIERVLQEAYRQRVAGIAARRLLETDDGSLDSEQCATLRAVIDWHIDRTQTVVLVAQKIASGLSRHRIPFTFVKGAGFLLL